MGQQIEELARFVAETRVDDIPEAVRRHAAITFLDTLGVILAGGARPEVAALRDRLSGGAGATIYGRGWPRADARTLVAGAMQPMRLRSGWSGAGWRFT